MCRGGALIRVSVSLVRVNASLSVVAQQNRKGTFVRVGLCMKGYVCACLTLYAPVCLCMHVRERAREGERESESESARAREREERERARERERDQNMPPGSSTTT